jgi:alkylhydroperoxidase/carboxymuconolactone decarboxylase family protein YurZ
MSDKERLDAGRRKFQEMYGDVLPLPASTPLSDFALKCFFAEVVGRNHFSPRERRLVILGSLAGLGADLSLVEIHTRSALNNGEIEASEFDDLLLLLQNYVGFPRIALMAHLFQKLQDESAGSGKAPSRSKAKRASARQRVTKRSV